MPLADRLVCCLIVLATATATQAEARELSIDDGDRTLSRPSLGVKVETAVHHRERHLVVRIQPTGLRTVDSPDGRTDTVQLPQRGLAFLPRKVACDRIVMRHGGRTHPPDLGSLCRDGVTLRHPGAGPRFVVFKSPGKVSAELVIPITMLPPEAPIPTRLSETRDAPAVATSPLLGPRERVVRLHVDERPDR